MVVAFGGAEFLAYRDTHPLGYLGKVLYEALATTLTHAPVDS
jgi:hypothetical protein